MVYLMLWFLKKYSSEQYTVKVSLNVASFFLPRDAMLARIPAKALCLSVRVCLPVTSRCSIKMDERIYLVFGREASFSTGHTLCFKEIQVST